jgi:hypothetical protein
MGAAEMNGELEIKSEIDRGETFNWRLPMEQNAAI